MTKTAQLPAWLHRLKPLDLVALVLMIVAMAVLLWAGSLPSDTAVFGLPSDTAFWSALLLVQAICLLEILLRVLYGRPDGLDMKVFGQALMWLGLILLPISQLLHVRDHGVPRLIVPLIITAFLMSGFAVYAYGFYADVIGPAWRRRRTGSA